MIDTNTIRQWNKEFAKSSATDSLRFFLAQFKGKIALSSSLGLEDQALTHMLLSLDPDFSIFTLDTGRLFPETYDLIERTCKKYHTKIDVFFPDSTDVEDMVKGKGINLFYESVANRKLCCGLRKLKPLARAMEGLDAWITGLRRDQSITRTDMQLVEWDEVNNLVKINPLIDWSEKDVTDYIDSYSIPVNPLHKKGFASIGCQPCTRAIEPGEDIRAGRWWWENADTRECGLHKK